MDEFDIIQKYFAPLAQAHSGASGLCNDGATLPVPKGYELAVTTDSLHEARHFIGDEPPGMIARKALRTNLSDLAAMGAEPYTYQLALSLPSKDRQANTAWLQAFTDALAEDQQAFGITLSGGDLTSTDGPLSITITAMGLVPEGAGLQRNGAQAGDHIVLMGAIGDAAAGLSVLTGKLNVDAAIADTLIARYRVPAVTTAIAALVRDNANAGIDISDGLHADLQHICTASKLDAEMNTDDIPLSKECTQLLQDGALDWPDILAGGDDYKLLLAVPAERLQTFIKAAQAYGLAPAVVGRFFETDRNEAALRIYDSHGDVIPIQQSGWKHF